MIEIVGLDEAFSVTEITIASNELVTIVFNNKDDTGEPHNLRITTPAETWFTLVAVAPDVQEITLSIAEPGEYPFLCDTHPQTMTGTLVVTP